jgi:ATP-dependent helicase/nuclease subunit B
VSLTLINGRAGSGKSQYCLDNIRKLLNQEPDGRPLILLLPEQATFQAERELASIPGVNGFVRAHVLGFRRLAYRVLSETGGAIRPQLTDLGKRLIISRLLAAYQDELKLFTGTVNRRNFADSLSGLIREFKNYGVTSDQLMTVKTTLGETALANKLHDLALIYQGFQSQLQHRYLDPEDYLKLLAEKISQAELFKGATVWIDGFHWFTPAEYAVLEQIIRTAADVSVTLCLPQPDAELHQRETSLFHRQYQTRLKLKHLAQKCGIVTSDILLEENRRFAGNKSLQHIESNYSGSAKPPLSESEDHDFAIVEAANRRVEVEGIACDIIRLCREEGYRWREIAVLLRAPEAYGLLVERIFEDYGIPFFSDRKRPAGHHPLAELLCSLLEIFNENWGYEPVFRCLKTGLFRLSFDDVERLENYVLEFGIRGSRWTNEAPWTFVRRLSLNEDAELDEKQQRMLSRINNIRNQVTAPLMKTARQLSEAMTVTGITTAIYQLLQEMDVAATMEKWADEAEKSGDLEQAKEHRQVWTGVIHLFDQLVETCGDQVVTLEEYSQVLQDGLEGLELSLIPPGLDHVAISSLEQTRMDTVRAAYIPGVTEGVFPMRGKGEGVLTDQDREALRQLGIELAPGVRDEVFAEQFLVYTAFTRARDFLWVSYPLADEDGKALTPSPEIGHLREMTGTRQIRSLAIEPSTTAERSCLAHPRHGLSALAVSLRRYKNGETVSEDWWDVYNWVLTQPALKQPLQTAVAGLFYDNQAAALPPELAKMLYCRQNRLRGSVTRFESYRACPFRHFAQYGLGLKERAVFQLKAPDLGQFLHAVLKEFGESMARNGRTWGSLNEDETRAICSEIVEQLAPKLQNEILLSNEQYKHMLGRLRRRVERAVGRLVDFDRASRFKPFALELPFGGDGAAVLPPLCYPLPAGDGLEIVGQIDRLDCVEHNGNTYLLVVDYKSGNARLSLTEVFYGLKLQLLTYLLAACKSAEQLFPGANIQPAGVLYYFLKNPSVSGNFAKSEAEISKEINRLMKMPGWVIKEQEIVRLIDSEINGWSEFIKIGFSKNQEFYSTCLAQLKSREEFEQLMAHVEKTFTETARTMLEGDITIKPYWLEQFTPCGYCPYLAVCQFDRLLPGNDYRVLPALDDDEIRARLAKKGGDS